MIRTGVIRFFIVVAPAPVWMKVGFAVAVALAVATLWLNPKDIDSALGTILLLQMFACSNGFSGAAAHGYFDALLVSGRPWHRVAACNLVAAALPGLLAWTTVVVVASLLGHPAVALSPQRQVALVLVSCTAWAAGLALPRLMAGALWSSILIALAMSRGPMEAYLHALQSVPAGTVDVLKSAALGAICPFLLLSDLPGILDRRVAAIDLWLALVVVLLGTGYISTRDYSLGALE